MKIRLQAAQRIGFHAEGERVGTWGTGPFDDDGASDWVWELQEAQDWRVVETALRGAADVGPDDYLEAPEVTEWIARHRETRPSEVRPLALQAVRRVLGANSELVDLCKEAGDDEWRANVNAVATALA